MKRESRWIPGVASATSREPSRHGGSPARNTLTVLQGGAEAGGPQGWSVKQPEPAARRFLKLVE